MLYVNVDELLLLDLIGEVDAGGDWVRSGLLSQPQGEDSVVGDRSRAAEKSWLHMRKRRPSALRD